jgi:hypothetical protein
LTAAESKTMRDRQAAGRWAAIISFIMENNLAVDCPIRRNLNLVFTVSRASDKTFAWLREMALALRQTFSRNEVYIIKDVLVTYHTFREAWSACQMDSSKQASRSTSQLDAREGGLKMHNFRGRRKVDVCSMPQ